jgi:hypothetical protein
MAAGDTTVGSTPIAVDPKGNVWIINNIGQIFSWNGSGWMQRPGSAGDIAIGANGSVLIVTNNNQNLRFWTNARWQGVSLPSSLSRGIFTLTVDAKGNPWICKPEVPEWEAILQFKNPAAGF